MTIVADRVKHPAEEGIISGPDRKGRYEGGYSPEWYETVYVVACPTCESRQVHSTWSRVGLVNAVSELRKYESAQSHAWQEPKEPKKWGCPCLVQILLLVCLLCLLCLIEAFVPLLGAVVDVPLTNLLSSEAIGFQFVVLFVSILTCMPILTFIALFLSMEWIKTRQQSTYKSLLEAHRTHVERMRNDPVYIQLTQTIEDERTKLGQHLTFRCSRGHTFEHRYSEFPELVGANYDVRRMKAVYHTGSKSSEQNILEPTDYSW